MARIHTLRCPCVHDSNYTKVLRLLKRLAEFGPDDVRCNPNVQKPGHWVVYIDVHAFLDAKFGEDFQALEGKECLKVFLPNNAYVLVGIGKSQEECDAEVAAANAAAGEATKSVEVRVEVPRAECTEVANAGASEAQSVEVRVEVPRAEECIADDA